MRNMRWAHNVFMQYILSCNFSQDIKTYIFKLKIITI